jgi:hypothetical protein
MYRPMFFDLITSWRWVVSFTPRPLYFQVKRPLYPLDRRLDGPQSRSGRHRSENSWPHRDSNSDPTVVQTVASRCADSWCCLQGVLRGRTGIPRRAGFIFSLSVEHFFQMVVSVSILERHSYIYVRRPSWDAMSNMCGELIQGIGQLCGLVAGRRSVVFRHVFELPSIRRI